MAYYPMTRGKLDDAHASQFHGKPRNPSTQGDIMVAAELRQTDARDGPEGDAVALNNSKYIRLPDNVTSPSPTAVGRSASGRGSTSGRTKPGSSSTAKAPQGELFGLRTWNVPGSLRSNCHGAFGTIGTSTSS